MASIGAVLKEEISRLARREIKRETAVIKKASSAHRKHIAALKRQVQALERKLRESQRQRAAAPAAAAKEEGTSHRFVAKGLKTLRSRLGLSAAAFGQLVGVSGQSVYHWEARKAVPRAKQVAAIAQLRGLGKKEDAERLAQLRTRAKPAAKRRPRKRATKRARR